MYPFASLPENLAAFCRELRDRDRFIAGPRELLDAARALTSVDIGDECKVRDTLRPILSSSVDEARRFDTAFSRFFLPGLRGIVQEQQITTSQHMRSDVDVPSGSQRTVAESRARASDDAESDDADGRAAEGAAGAIDARDGGEDAAGILRSRYSPIDVDTTLGPRVSPAAAAWRAAARSFVRRMHLGLSRRWRPGSRGRRFDLRRTLRASLQTGGEPMSPRWLRRSRLAPRFLVLVDGSRSMSPYWQPSLEFAVAMAAVTPRLDVFVFSTTVERITREVRKAAAGDRTEIDGLSRAWGGGTAIGSSIAGLLRQSSRHLLDRDTVMIVVSDGLDVDRPEALRDAIREVQRKSAGVIWLNPMAGTPGYQPTAAAMRAALPFVSSFACVTSPAELLCLSRGQAFGTRPIR